MNGIRAIQERVTSTSTGYAVERTAQGEHRESVSRPAVRYGALALTVACFVALTILKAAGHESGVVPDALRAVFAADSSVARYDCTAVCSVCCAVCSAV